MRLRSDFFVSALIRRAETAGSIAMLRRRGSEEAGAIFVKINRLDGTADVYAPAPQTAFDEDRPSGRIWTRATGGEPADDAKAEEYLARQFRFDSDIWVVEVEDRTGRHFLDLLAD